MYRAVHSGTLKPTQLLETLRNGIRKDIPILTYERHVNDPEFGVEVADLFNDLMSKE